ncbi:MAG: YkgJ family cysteine cluster protein [Chitinophagaceae bacterium]|nr:YkgJ family cysteine cluster protein [Chitinophagaceae bacterium]
MAVILQKKYVYKGLSSFRKWVKKYKKSFRLFLAGLEKKRTPGLKNIISGADTAVWSEMNCLSCANCCKNMTPTYKLSDIRRIASHLGMTVSEFKHKWLKKERKPGGDWVNKKTPCQFLNLATNKCTIYEIRPHDCRHFPHHHKNFRDYGHIIKQNLEYCPATFLLVQKIIDALSQKKN